jgi:hypothetical protein
MIVIVLNLNMSLRGTKQSSRSNWGLLTTLLKVHRDDVAGSARECREAHPHNDMLRNAVITVFCRILCWLMLFEEQGF